MFNSYMLQTLPFKTGSFFICVMYITARVAHLHENRRLSERDKPKASSCELDVVFGIPNSRKKGFFPSRRCRISPFHAFSSPNNHYGSSLADYFLSAEVTKILL